MRVFVRSCKGRSEVVSMREMRGYLRTDEGMTLVEVLIASLIMFVILSGILVLVTTSTLMGTQATQKNLLTNAVNSYVEWAAALPFKQVDLVGTGEGILEPKTISENGYTIVITPSVAPVSGNTALKNLTLSLVMTDGAGNSHSYSTTVAIRDRSQFLTQAKKDSALAPDVSFGSLTPPDRSVVWGSRAQGDVPLYLDVVANAAEDRLISRVVVSFDGGTICENANSLPQFSEWVMSPGLATWSSSMEFVWNTKQQYETFDEYGASTGFADAVSDGWRIIKAVAVDDGNLEDVDRRYYLVDNYPPADVVETSMTVAPITATSAGVNWKTVMDQGTGADSYMMEWVRQAAGHTEATEPFGYWDASGSHHRTGCLDIAGGTPLTQALTLEPFSRYAVRVRAQSPSVVRVAGQPAASLNSAWAQQVFVTRPLVTGAYTISRPNKNTYRIASSLSVTPPAFPVSGVVQYAWYRAVGTGAYQLLADKTGAAITDSYDQAVKNTNEAGQPLSYKCVITYAVGGYAPQTATVESNRVTTTATSGTFTVGTW